MLQMVTTCPSKLIGRVSITSREIAGELNSKAKTLKKKYFSQSNQ